MPNNIRISRALAPRYLYQASRNSIPMEGASNAGDSAPASEPFDHSAGSINYNDDWSRGSFMDSFLDYDRTYRTTETHDSRANSRPWNQLLVCKWAATSSLPADRKNGSSGSSSYYFSWLHICTAASLQLPGSDGGTALICPMWEYLTIHIRSIFLEPIPIITSPLQMLLKPSPNSGDDRARARATTGARAKARA
ncbi:hypothetical protein V8E54_010381 [Elaphomyces granulatus]